MSKLTPNLIVSSIERCLPFWVQRLGFERTVEVPHGDRLGFVILVKDELELMLQSQASFEADVPAVAAGPHHAVLYFQIADLDTIKRALDGYEALVEERTTFYGAREVIAKDPEGHVVFFAARDTSTH